ncbi:MAG: hypothetical protein JNK05_24670 [Myxococcales bacterium]|nr:hypothetical protein [Myxococcales bacterium]
MVKSFAKWVFCGLERGVAALVALLVVVGGACAPIDQCPPVSDVMLSRIRPTLAETGLFAPGSTDALAPGVRAYRPRYELWSDGASKRRWIWLPPGTRIDATDVDSWQFPVGTRLWKEFSFAGRRVETRYMERFGDGWLFISYAWNNDGTSAAALPLGGTTPTSGTHSIPSAHQCLGCHGGRASRVLGFSAMQLTDARDGPTVRQLIDAGLLAPEAREVRVDGDAVTRDALGYLHANCSHCHNQSRPPSGPERCFNPQNEIDFFTSARDTGGAASLAAVRSFAARRDEILDLVGRTSAQGGMPPLAKAQVDSEGVAILRAFAAAQ